MSNPKTTRISALLPTYLINEVKKVSEVNNTAQSTIIKNALELWLKNRLCKDAKELAKRKFADLPTEDDWLSIQPEIK